MRKVILICVVAAAVFVAGCGGSYRSDGEFAFDMCKSRGGVAAFDGATSGFTAFTCKDGSFGEVNPNPRRFYPATKEQTND